MITVYGYAPSGNCWKVAQILRLAEHEFRRVGHEFRRVGHEFRWVETDSNRGEGTPWMPAPGLTLRSWRTR